jgi:hypothetical protein
MHRIDSATAEQDTHGAGKDGFTDGTPPSVPPTDLTAKWFNAVQEEIANVVEGTGIALSAASSTQLDTALDLIVKGVTLVTSAAGTTTLTSASNATQVVTGTTTQTIKLPNETTLAVGRSFRILNTSTGIVTVQDSGSNTLFTIPPPQGTNRAEMTIVISKSSGAATGNWVYFHGVPNHTQGTTTNDSATSGDVGEYQRVSVVTVSAGSSTVAFNCTSLSLTAGDWDVSATLIGNLNGATVTVFEGEVSTTSATMAGSIGAGAEFKYKKGALPTASLDSCIEFPQVRLSLSATTTVYLVARYTYSAGTPRVHAAIQARRAR